MKELKNRKKICVNTYKELKLQFSLYLERERDSNKSIHVNSITTNINLFKNSFKEAKKISYRIKSSLILLSVSI